MNVTMYIKPTCPFCKRAIALLNQHGLKPTIIDIAADPSKRPEMLQKSRRTTVPQIFFGDAHIGGCDDLEALAKNNGLTKYLNGNG